MRGKLACCRILFVSGLSGAKATWSSEQQEKGFYYLAAIDARRGRMNRALEHIERALVKNAHNVKARGLKAYLLRRTGRLQEALRQVQDNLELDSFDFVSGNERICLEGDPEGEKRQALNGRLREARARFYRLIDYGERHLEDTVKIPYFAVSLPEFLIFDENYTLRNRAHCYYLMALGNMGLGDTEKAAGFLDEAVKVEPSHMMCRVYMRALNRGIYE